MTYAIAQFAHLHVASSFSLRYGTASPAALVARAAGLGMPALALTDRDGLYGAFKYAQACVNAGIKPILGADLALRPASQAATGRECRVTLLAVGRQGWASLCRLVSAAHAPQTPHTPQTPHAPHTGNGASEDDAPAVTQEMIATHADGLMVLLGPSSDVGQAIAARRPHMALRALDRWREHADAVVEIVDLLEHGSTYRAARMAELAHDTRTPAVLTNAVRYLDPADSRAAQVLDAARHLVPLGSPRLVPHNGRAYLAGQADMAAIAERVTAAMTGPSAKSGRLLAATAELAERCALDPARDLGIGSHHLPETRHSGTEQEELRERCEHAPARPLPFRPHRLPQGQEESTRPPRP
jgi:error-prone DNA polymerase